MNASQKPKISSAKELVPSMKEVPSSNNSTSEPFKTWDDVIRRDITCEEKFALLKKNTKLLQTKVKERNL